MQIVTDTGRPELDRIEQLFFAQIHKGARELKEIPKVTRLHRCGVRRRPHQVGPNQFGLQAGISCIAIVGVGVALGMSRHFTIVAIVVAVVAKMVAVAHKSRAAAKGDNL